MTLFVDSSFVIALADGDDQFHETAQQLVKSIQKSEKVISDLVLSESVTGVAARLGQKAGMGVFENLVYDSTTKVVYLNKRLCERSLHLYLKYGQRLSFADAISVRIMYDRKIKSIASFDSDFDGVDGISRISNE
ncbi:MAG: type II toxin-antitoxin system VapC family toxin [Nitrososphaerota archaeon]|nr:type II toxin-antitoxin system VapC family toxin [Nitrososphaerota archaeon]